MYRLTFHVTNTKRKYKVDKKTGKNIGKGEVHNTISIKGFKTVEDAQKRYAVLREEVTYIDNMIELLGWAATAVVLAGFIVNSRGQHLLALALWLVGDIAWTIYDVCIDNYSHMVLSSAIIAINLYGYKNIKAKDESNNLGEGQRSA